MEKLRELRERVLQSPVAVMLLLIPLYSPLGLSVMSDTVMWVMMGWKGLVYLFVGILFLSRPKVTPLMALLGVYQVLLAVGTLMNPDASRYEWLLLTANVIGICMLMEMSLETDARTLLKCMFWLLSLLCLANLITVVAFPGGMYSRDRYLFGRDNGHSFYLIPAMATAVIYARYRWGRWLIRFGVVAVLSLTVYITWAVSGVLGITAFFALFLLYPIRHSGRLFNVATYYIVIAAMFLLFVVFKVQDRFAFLIEDVLGKSLTFSGRTAIWDRAFAWAAQRPVFGYGVTTSAVQEVMVGNVFCHNVIVQVIMDSGYVGLAVYCAILFTVARPLMKRREHPVGYTLAAAMFAFLLVLMAESITFPVHFYGICVMAYHTEDIIAAFEKPAALPES